MFKVLVVDDDADLRLSVASALTESHYFVEQAKDGEECVNKVRANKFDLVLLDVNMPRMTGMEALKEIKEHDPSTIVIVLTAFSNVRDAIEATKQGAYNYLEKPIKAENLVYLIDKALKAHSMVKNLSMSAPVIQLPDKTEFVGKSLEMKRVFSVIEKLARVETAVLIRGESGTGKELVAKALHFNGPRKDHRFVTVNCSAIPENLIESEFFGHEKGAFTGADSRKIGHFQYADGGTLFLDEIGDISPAMQVKLLRALQEKRFNPVGSNREVEVNVRIVAATNRNLEEMIKQGQFREDLYYRLNVLPIRLPPLRERRNDIEALANYFVEKFRVQHAKRITGISKEALDLLKTYQWPGNIRELENVIEHAFVLETGTDITLDSLPETIVGPRAFLDSEDSEDLTDSETLQSLEILDQEENAALTDDLGSHMNPRQTYPAGDDSETSVEGDKQINLVAEAPTLVGDSATGRPAATISLNFGDPKDERGFRLDINRLDFQANKEEFERQFLISALKAFKGKINQTALHANIPKKTLLRKLEKYGIVAKDYSNKGSSN